MTVRIMVENHSDLVRSFKLHEVLAEEAVAVSPAAKVISTGGWLRPPLEAIHRSR